jgi:hypothetical protein
VNNYFSSKALGHPHATLVFRPGTTKKLWQLTGDFDPERQVPTASRSGAQANVRGTDLGATFEYEGNLVFLFGDTAAKDPSLGAGSGYDSIAVTHTKDPQVEPYLHWLRLIDNPSIPQSTKNSPFVPQRLLGTYNPIQIISSVPREIDYRDFCVPMHGFEGAAGAMYVFYTQPTLIPVPGSKDEQMPGPTSGCILIRSDDGGYSFRYVYDCTYGYPLGKFYQPWAMVVEASDWPGLPWANGPTVLIWGTDTSYGRSPVYLACCQLSDIENAREYPALRLPKSWAYFAGVLDNTPFWSGSEDDAVPLFDQIDDVLNLPAMREFSVTYIESLGLWLMLYCFPGSDKPLTSTRGIYCRQSEHPWGPWRLVGEELPKNAINQLNGGKIWAPDLGYGHYMHQGNANDGLNLVGDGVEPPTITGDAWGGEYAANIIRRWCNVKADQLTLRYSLSTWNPYQIVLLESKLDITWSYQ